MAHHPADLFSTKYFTPKEHQVKVFEAACRGNIVVSLINTPGKKFISCKVIEHTINYAFPGTFVLCLATTKAGIARQAASFRRLTCCSVLEVPTLPVDVETVSRHQVLVATVENSLIMMKEGIISPCQVKLLILHHCHRVNKDPTMRELIKYVNSGTASPRVLGLAGSFLPAVKVPYIVETEISLVESSLHCVVDTAGDTVTVLQYGSEAKECLLEYSNSSALETTGPQTQIELEISEALQFLRDQNFDYCEYEGYEDDYVQVPDPTVEPARLFNKFLNILHTLGLFAADKAAYVLLTDIENLKMRTPYERHYLLICLVSTVMIKIRAILDRFFESIDDKDKIFHYSTSKLLRIFEVVQTFREKTEIWYGSDSQGVGNNSLNKGEVEKPKTKSVENDLVKENLSNKFEGRKCKCHRIIDIIFKRLDNPSLSLDLNSLEPCRQNMAFAKSVLPNIKSHKHKAELVESRKGHENNNRTSGSANMANGGQGNVTTYSRGHRKERFDWRSGRRGPLLDSKENFRPREIDPHALCGLILVDDDFTARVLFYIFAELRCVNAEFSFLRIHFTVALAEDAADGVATERAYRKQELVLKNFRMRECNLLIGTSFLESGIDLPRCNLVVRFDAPRDYQSYAQGKARAHGPDAIYCMLAPQDQRRAYQSQLACYHIVEQMLCKKGLSRDWPHEDEEEEADRHGSLIKPFCPTLTPGAAYVGLSSAIALLNKYCAKLPSDTFTRLTPLWSEIKVPNPGGDLFICTIRLPTNSPLKEAITGPAMPTNVLARRFAALLTCLKLQANWELDDDLLPITKETFWMKEEETLSCTTKNVDDQVTSIMGADPRPGTTKRRQYYNKRTAECLTDCRPVVGEPCKLYDISMTLTCPLPEEQNTRGRQIRAPENSPRGFGILTGKRIPTVGVFPIFTRAGEVAVKLKLSPESVVLTSTQMEKIVPFINFTFTSVLRLQKYLMMFDPDTSENAYFVVPTIKGDTDNTVQVDWEFLDLIYETRNQVPKIIPDKDREDFKFEPERYQDAVVCPWYRNQDQPQYFYVAEICDYLTPKAAFPGIDYSTFEEYYLSKYGIQIQNTSQALLDVDHTSARLNFLTPRYVNRKGVALPTTSEAKKRAKRENLGQKQILVPELCDVHPFPASLWQKAVCLPCILHRLNALLLADEVRRLVARDLGLGDPGDPDTVWRPLDFGWNLADVLNKSKHSETKGHSEARRCESAHSVSSSLPDSNHTPWMEVGTWTNDLAEAMPTNVTFLCGPHDSEIGWNSNHQDQELRYGSPTSWLRGTSSTCDVYNSASESSISDSYDESSDDSDEDPEHGLRIEFKDKDLAEAVEPQRWMPSHEDTEEDEEPWECNEEFNPLFEENKIKYEKALQEHTARIETDGVLCPLEQTFALPWASELKPREMPHSLSTVFGTANNKIPELVDDFAKIAKDLPHANFIKCSLLKYEVLATIKSQEGTISSERRGKAKTPHTGTHQYCNGLDTRESFFSFDAQPELNGHPGPSPSLILQALTMSNANDGINLERLETIGDSFLKYAITTFLYCTYENVHEGKLSHLRSKQVSNLNLYRLGKQKVFAESMVATKFEPHDNWLPPCYFVPRELERALIEAGLPASQWNRVDLPALHSLSREEVASLVRERTEQIGLLTGMNEVEELQMNLEGMPCFIPYNLMTQHSIPDKSVADCVEALIGAYLVACGPRGALLFMSWLGIKVLPCEEVYAETCGELLKNRVVGQTTPVKTKDDGKKAWRQIRFGEVVPPAAPLLRHVVDPEGELSCLLTGFEEFEAELHYRFRDRSYLLQAVTHASYSVNQLTDCYQRLEFLGDAVLDYLITRHLFEDPRHHSPGSLTDLRSALVNNTIFASLAVRHGFHRFFRHQCPALHEVLDRFVLIQQENDHAITDECYLVEEDDSEEAEDVEVPKALGDVFESVAGAVFLDSGMSLDAVWRVYYRIMKTEIDTFSTNVPKSPIRELLELEPETVQFGKPEKLADGRRVRVAVEVFGKGTFKGIGRNYRIAKCTAAKCALKQLKRRGLLQRNK